MREIGSKETCGRGSELISLLYGEATEREAIDFQQHAQVCTTCTSELASFGQLRESIDAWKFEALSGFATPQVPISQQSRRNRSALAALGQFFELSPPWLKGATAFASLLFVLLAVLVFGRFKTSEPRITQVKSGAIYTKEEMNMIVQKALDEQKISLSSMQKENEEPEPTTALDPPLRSRRTQRTGSRRPLSRWEREQLAADLRLLEQDEDDGLELLGDRINQPEY